MNLKIGKKMPHSKKLCSFKKYGVYETCDFISNRINPDDASRNQFNSIKTAWIKYDYKKLALRPSPHIFFYSACDFSFFLTRLSFSCRNDHDTYLRSVSQSVNQSVSISISEWSWWRLDGDIRGIFVNQEWIRFRI